MGEGASKFSVTVSPEVVTLVSGPPSAFHSDWRSSAPFSFRTLNENATSAGVIGVPSLNFTPLRIVKVSAVRLEFQL